MAQVTKDMTFGELQSIMIHAQRSWMTWWKQEWDALAAHIPRWRPLNRVQWATELIRIFWLRNWMRHWPQMVWRLKMKKTFGWLARGLFWLINVLYLDRCKCMDGIWGDDRFAVLLQKCQGRSGGFFQRPVFWQHIADPVKIKICMSGLWQSQDIYVFALVLI